MSNRIRLYFDNNLVKNVFFISDVMELDEKDFVKSEMGLIDHVMIALSKAIDGDNERISSYISDINSIIRVVDEGKSSNTQTLYRVCGAKDNDDGDTVSLFLSKIQDVTYDKSPSLFVDGVKYDNAVFRMKPSEIVGNLCMKGEDVFSWVSTLSISFSDDQDLLSFFNAIDNGDTFVRYADTRYMYHVHNFDHSVLSYQESIDYDNLTAELVLFMG